MCTERQSAQSSCGTYCTKHQRAVSSDVGQVMLHYRCATTPTDALPTGFLTSRQSLHGLSKICHRGCFKSSFALPTRELLCWATSQNTKHYSAQNTSKVPLTLLNSGPPEQSLSSYPRRHVHSYCTDSRCPMQAVFLSILQQKQQRKQKNYSTKH